MRQTSALARASATKSSATPHSPPAPPPSRTRSRINLLRFFRRQAQTGFAVDSLHTFMIAAGLTAPAKCTTAASRSVGSREPAQPAVWRNARSRLAGARTVAATRQGNPQQPQAWRSLIETRRGSVRHRSARPELRLSNLRAVTVFYDHRLQSFSIKRKLGPPAFSAAHSRLGAASAPVPLPRPRHRTSASTADRANGSAASRVLLLLIASPSFRRLSDRQCADFWGKVTIARCGSFGRCPRSIFRAPSITFSL